MTDKPKPTLTYHDVARGLSHRPCKDDFKQACDVLPDWKKRAYSPTEMAAHGVKHSSIMWAWLRPEVMGRQAMIEAACRMAEEVLPLFEKERPGDTRPRDAIAAARKCAANPTEENKAAAADAARAAWAAWAAADAARAAVAEAAWAVGAAADAARAAWAAVAEAAWAAGAAGAAVAADAARAAARTTAESRQVEILEDVIKEYGERND